MVQAMISLLVGFSMQETIFASSQEESDSILGKQS